MANQFVQLETKAVHREWRVRAATGAQVLLYKPFKLFLPHRQKVLIMNEKCIKLLSVVYGLLGF